MQKKILQISMLLFFCAGCFNQGSINPYYTRDRIVRMPELNGMWSGVENDREGKEKKSCMEIKGQKFISRNDDGTKDSAGIIFFKVEDTLFADVQVDKIKGDRKRPPHLLFKLASEKNQLTFIPLDYEWLEKKTVSGEIKLPYIKEKEESGVLFSAKPQEWVEFIKANKDNPGVFVEKEKFVLRRE